MRIGLIKHTTIFFITLFPTLSVAATDIKTICNGGGGRPPAL
ncbi:hypothetical protein [Helicobacter sp. 16-1353]|nr:hypothetical protein [Helicobacter sp. 16-1353]